ncbi:MULTISPECIES: hypothetical protein [Sphaerospermopsis]|jgi:hypothetical protein|uniref:Uncharacterized protein n=2 Tax=Sphaerospermopsis TaxID=752201 RepID=A0A479ZT94_9CYAN|nr:MULTISPECIES: hypothetical protein [Sphaerospermopsis]MBD2134600.1 hypothetical protein [Sphaerospermopsis sp. FACHB-1094]MBD2146657.1 hypothetical protein [Sphaerospermopsis sp. FACHB-1194]MBE9237462.1 hypothetical protein [Sphaerospermopsis aphanizomenoides LEGE 00250]GCL35735.1 hypothetical protein SR1949_08320 [Sphaerospermopsis reniformis]
MNRSLFKILGWGWGLFLIAGVAITQISPRAILLIDKSYCPPEQWQKVAQTYAQKYQTSQLHTVILFDDLSQEKFSLPPQPSVISQLSTYGRPNLKRQSQLQKTYPKAQLLSCRLINN